MGLSTDGHVFYGVEIGEGELPWEEEGLLEWWVFGVHGAGFSPRAECPYDEDGNYAPGVEAGDDRIGAWHAERLAYRKKVEASVPCPVEDVNVCSADYPLWYLAVRGTVRTCNRGYPTSFDPADLTVTDDQRAALRDFVATYLPEFSNNEPAWFLASSMG